MPDPDRLLKTISRAIDATRQVPGRCGKLIELRDAEDLLVAGDMHGHLPNFQHVYQSADLAHHPRRHLVLQEVVHGKFRYPRGGDKSHQLLDLFCALKNQFPARVHLLMGNHELAQGTDHPIIKADEDLNALFIEGVDEAYGRRSAEIYGAYRELFAVLPLAIRTEHRILLCHSLPSARHAEKFSFDLLRNDESSPDDLAAKGWIHSLLWGRGHTSEPNVAAFLEKADCDWLISGHIPCEQGFEAPNDRQIILDCCMSPAAYALFPASRPLTREELLDSIHVI